MAIDTTTSVDVQTLTPFKKFIMTIGNLPTSYLESMTYAELLMWFCNYLQETVIPTVNNNAEAVEELQGLYEELKQYVNDYFNNLDVQEEINNKLDSMVEDGTLTEMIGTYVDPKLEEFKNEVNEDLDYMNNLVVNATSGSPLVASSTADMTDHERVYVNTSDGKWYYWNGSAWSIGGTYQSSGISERSIKGISTNFFESANKLYIPDGTYTANGVTAVSSNGVITLNGTSSANGSIFINLPYSETLKGLYRFDYFGISDLPNSSMRMGLKYSGSSVNDFTLDIRQSCIVKIDTDHTFDRFSIYIPSGVTCEDYVVKPMLSLYTSLDVTDTFKSYNDSLTRNSKIKEINLNNTIKEEQTTFMKQGINIIDPRKLTQGFCNSFNSSTKKPTIQNNSEYQVYIIYPQTTQKVYTFYPRLRGWNLFSGTNNNYNTATQTPTITVPANTMLVVNFYTNDLPNLMAVEGESIESYVPFKYTIDYLDTNMEVTQLYHTDVLYGKKWVACGDSFTAGSFNGSLTNDYTITDGMYKGHYKVYPYLIGNRTLMNVQNIAAGGMSMATYVDGSNCFSKENGLYTQIAEDADYITLKFGINDDTDHHDIPIGTIDDDTNETFYGAWNIVMEYIIEHHPEAKIGIIVSNGINDTDYVDATIAIAKKFGVAYLNESTDDKVPLMLRSLRTDVDSDIKAFRNNEWYVNPSGANQNWHPNEKCHEYESTIVEDFLRRL